MEREQARVWTKEVRDKLAARDEEYPNRDYPKLPTDFLADFSEKSEECYNITILAACAHKNSCPDSVKYAMPVYSRFIDKFNLNLAEALNTFTANFESQDIFDSITLEIKKKGTQYPSQVIQNADFTKNIDCFKKAVGQEPGNYAKWCDKYENLIYFKVTDYTAQDMNLLST